MWTQHSGTTGIVKRMERAVAVAVAVRRRKDKRVAARNCEYERDETRRDGKNTSQQEDTYRVCTDLDGGSKTHAK